MIGTEHILKEIDKVIQQAYEKGVKDGIQQAQKQDNILTDEELATFLAYTDDCMHSLAFSNSDWIEVYKKITNDRISEKAKTRIASYRELDEPFL